MDDNTKVCGQCGTHVEGDISASPVKIIDPQMHKKFKNIFKLVIVLVLVATVGITAFNVVSKFTGYNGLIRKVMTAYEKYDIDTLVALSSDIYCYGEENYAEDYFENIVGTAIDSFEASVGHSYQMSYEGKETYTISERKANEILEGIGYSYSDFDVSIIEELVNSDIIITAEQDGKLVNRDINVTMSKENGSWKLLYIE